MKPNRPSRRSATAQAGAGQGSHKRGIAGDVFERAPELTEIGAAIAMSANSTCEFARLGLLEQLDAVRRTSPRSMSTTLQALRAAGATPRRISARWRFRGDCASAAGSGYLDWQFASADDRAVDLVGL